MPPDDIEACLRKTQRRNVKNRKACESEAPSECRAPELTHARKMRGPRNSGPGCSCEIKELKYIRCVQICILHGCSGNKGAWNDAETIRPTTCHYHGRWPAPLPGTLRQVTPGGAYRLRAQGTTTATTTRVINGGCAAETDIHKASKTI